ncbi:WxL domain-containing protein [Enterococcus mundtii]|uniref:WxL domain-containing protein n=1 Tax=Enterococcus mundtii TaxID=53346 RepID=A0A848N0J4_ENTMU|nr:WxL domain-containing protein [Enterococcus mundtii]NMP59795.1 hypothetical protein [Enterococcus mundtii]
MIINKLRKMILLITILAIPILFMPIGSLVYSETSDNYDGEQEKPEISNIENYLRIEQESEPKFFFENDRLEGTVKELMKVTFFSDTDVFEVRVILPKEANMLEEELSAGVDAKHGEKPYEWIIQTKCAQNTFVIALEFELTGSYELFVNDVKTTLEIVEQEVEDETINDKDKSDFSLESYKEEEFLDFDDDLVANEGLDNEIERNISEQSDTENKFNTIVHIDNFLEYFGLTGQSYLDGDLVVMTTNGRDQTGGFYLKNKINSNYPFRLEGKVFLGVNNNSADGMGFGFHRDEAGAIGLPASGFGMAGLRDIFGFKLDTYYNRTNFPPYRPDPISSGAFGSFVYMDNEWFTSYMGDNAPARSINRPSNVYTDISISLSENSILRVDYEGKVWEKELPENLSNNDLSFLVSSSTGSVTAWQQFHFESFSYSRNYSEVIIKFVDQDGLEILQSENLTGLVGDNYQTAYREISGYTLSEIPENSSGLFTEETQIVKYVYEKNHFDSVLPLDPLSPDKEVQPDRPAPLPEDQGPLSFDFISSFSFGSQVISVNDQTYYALPQRLLNEDGTVNETEERPNYVQISDRRPVSERNGWQLSVTQNGQFSNQNGHELIGSEIQLFNQELVTAQGGTMPELQEKPVQRILPNTKKVLLQADKESGTGTWIYRFGDQNTADKSVGLYVPKGTNPEATSYSTKLTWELSSVPDN